MKFKFEVGGMTCAACSARVEKVSKKVPGVMYAEVNLLKGTMQLEAENDQCVPLVINAIRDAGYQASLSGSKSPRKMNADAETGEMKRRIICSAVLLIVLMYFTMGHMFGLPLPAWYHGSQNAVVAALLQLFLTLPVVFLNRAYYTRGFRALCHRSPNMDSLIAIGSASALVYGIIALFRMAWAAGHSRWDVVDHYSGNLYFESAAMILTLITVGKFLEARAKGKTGDAIRKLMDLSPKTATLLKDGVECTVPVEQVTVGDSIVIRSGSAIPVDGTILEGRGTVDQSALTGESIPVERTVGDTVAAATVNTEGYFVFRADKVGEDTTLSQIIHLVEDAGGSKAPIARLADKIAGIFVPTVMSIAFIAFSAWMLMGKGVEFALNIGISVLVISCPCALGLATPVAIMVGTGKGAGIGVMFKNAEALENLHKIDTVVVDKTGTLTVGKPRVTDVHTGAMEKKELLRIAAALEAKSEHPFAKAILGYAADVEYPDSCEFESLPGHGVSAIIDGVRYYAGNESMMASLGFAVPDHNKWKIQGKTPLYFASETLGYLGSVAAADVLKTDSAVAVKALQKLGLEVVMLTGDNQKTADAVAAAAGISRVISDVLPADKAAQIRKLKEEGHRVLMVGDGINDAPALVTADVGMAIGAGTDIAIESADVVLMKESLVQVSNAVALSKATMRTIRQNLFWAFFYNALGIPIAAGVLYFPFGILLSPMLGAAAMSCSSLFVVSNSLRLRFFKEKNIPGELSAQESSVLNKEDEKMETVIYVNGMMCPHCQARVEQVCKGIPGVTDASVDLQQKLVRVSGSFDVEAVKKAIADAGYEVVG